MSTTLVSAYLADVSQHTLFSLEFPQIRRMLCSYITSESGKKMAMALAPSADPVWIDYELRLTEECMQAFLIKGSLAALELAETGASLRLLAVAGSVLDPEALAGIFQQLATVRRVRHYFKGSVASYPLITHEIIDPLNNVSTLYDAIDRVFDDRFAICDSASPDLARIRRQRREVHRDLEKKISNLAHTLGRDAVLQEERFTIRAGRLVLPVKAEQMGAIHGVVHDRSASGATLFVEPMETVGHNNKLKELELDERNELLHILRSLSEIARPYGDALECNRHLLLRLEFIVGKTTMATALDSRRPELGNSINLVGARHPLLLASVLEEEQGPCVSLHPQRAVPLTLSLGDGPKTLVITGPNAGGKTVALKTMGLLTLMVQSGLPIPVAEGSSLRIFSRLSADIGDEQSIENDLSTFSSHMKRISEMVQGADVQSLVLIDELCTGTDPDFSTALAMAVLEHFTACGCMTAVTTHYGAIKAFAHERKDVMNGSMVFDEAGLVPTYRFRPGLPGGSYAFEVSHQMGLKADVLERARTLVDPATRRVENLVTDLEESLRHSRAHEEATRIARDKLNSLQKKYQDLLDGVKIEKRTILKDAHNTSLGIMNDASRLVEKTVESIRKHQASKASIKAAREVVLQAKNEAIAEKINIEKEIPQIHTGKKIHAVVPGDRVVVLALQQEGVVVTANGTKIMVHINDKLVRVALAGLRVCTSPQKEAEGQKTRYSGIHTEINSDDMGPEIRLMGKTADEALDALERYFDRSIMAGLLQVNIIHGSGSGVLRQKIRSYLDTCPFVAGYRSAEQNAGGNGVTVVMLND